MKRLLSSIIFIFMFASHAQTSNEEKLSYYGFDDEVHNYINEIEKTGKRSSRTDCVNCGAKSGGIGGDLFPVAVVVMVHAI